MCGQKIPNQNSLLKDPAIIFYLIFLLKSDINIVFKLKCQTEYKTRELIL
jgi:hypothetical protein